MKTILKLKKLSVCVLAAALCVCFAAALSSCATSGLKGEYGLIAVRDESETISFGDFEYYTLTITDKSRERSYKIEYKLKAGGFKEILTGDWYFEKKTLKFYQTLSDDQRNREAWDKKNKTITIVRYGKDGKSVSYILQKK